MSEKIACMTKKCCLSSHTALLCVRHRAWRRWRNGTARGSPICRHPRCHSLDPVTGARIHKMHLFLAVNLGVLAMLVADRQKTARSGARRRSSPPALCLRLVRHGTAECGDPTTTSAVGVARPTTSRKAQACLPGCRMMGHRPGRQPRRASSRLRHSRHRCVRWSASNAVKSRVRRLRLTPRKAQKRPRPSRQVGLPGSLMCNEMQRGPSTGRPHPRSARWISSVCGRICRVAMPTREHLRPRHHRLPSPRRTRAPRQGQLMHV